jgi:hypothetical protein
MITVLVVRPAIHKDVDVVSVRHCLVPALSLA